ncbi:hypothetical protein [Pseudonocardia sp. H11422]|uniref:hypothetical protein n=1 Tax=Pseudonocardia sp. H11422 TaxID=2835866 RepID=UPI001BDC5DFA|nr:hypothetical protein [Pseudonocardia sp. H11422]
MSMYPPPGSYEHPASADPLVPLNLDQWFGKVFGVVRRSWRSLTLIQLAATLPGLLLGGLAQWIVLAGAAPTPDPVATAAAAGGVVAIVFAIFAQGASVFVAIREAVGRPVQAGDALRFAAGRALPLLGWGLLSGVLIFVGLLLLILPGIYVATVVVAALVGVVVVERGGIDRAFTLVNRRLLPTFGRMVIFFVAGLVYSTVVGVVVELGTEPGSLSELLLGGVLALPLSLASVGVAVVTYAELRFHENTAVSSGWLAAELER